MNPHHLKLWRDINWGYLDFRSRQFKRLLDAEAERDSKAKKPPLPVYLGGKLIRYEGAGLHGFLNSIMP